MSDTLEFLTPVGRIVQGSAFKPNTTDMYGNPLVHKSGPQAGQPREEWYLGLAIEKNNPDLPTLFGIMTQAADQTKDVSLRNNPSFAWKFIDGDGVDANGKPYSQREGWAGHWIFKLSSGFKPTCWNQGGVQQLTDPNSIPCGYFVRVHGTTAPNNSHQSPGIYLNFDMVELIAYGDPIQFGPDSKEVFGASPVTSLPPGASTTPPAPATTVAPPGTTEAAPASNTPPDTTQPPGTPPTTPHTTIMNAPPGTPAASTPPPSGQAPIPGQ